MYNWIFWRLAHLGRAFFSFIDWLELAGFELRPNESWYGLLMLLLELSTYTENLNDRVERFNIFQLHRDGGHRRGQLRRRGFT